MIVCLNISLPTPIRTCTQTYTWIQWNWNASVNWPLFICYYCCCNTPIHFDYITRSFHIHFVECWKCFENCFSKVITNGLEHEMRGRCAFDSLIRVCSRPYTFPPKNSFIPLISMSIYRYKAFWLGPYIRPLRSNICSAIDSASIDFHLNSTVISPASAFRLAVCL